jgi:hypothetical protein
MFTQDSTNNMSAQEQEEFDFYLQWDWPEHIETALRRLLWISLVEAAEYSAEQHQHTKMLRWMIATHPDTAPEVIDFLSTIDDADLLTRLAENPQTSAQTLEKLAQHTDSTVRLAVADNKNTPLTILLEMAVGSDVDVRYQMAENPALSAKMLTQLAQDSNAYVADRAEKTLLRRNPAAVQQLPVRTQRQQRKAM